MFARVLRACFASALLAACSQEPPTWQQLLAAKVRQQFPSYEVVPQGDGSLIVHRPGLPDSTIDVAAIARFCQRGPKDCNYATDTMLQSLQPPAK